MNLSSSKRAAGRSPAHPAREPGPAACFTAARPGQPGSSRPPVGEPGPDRPSLPGERPTARAPSAPVPGWRTEMPFPEPGVVGTSPGPGTAHQAPSPGTPVGTEPKAEARGRERSAREKLRRAAGVSLADLQAAAMSEDELEEQVRDACTKLGILRFHVRVSKGTTAGLPDDILIGPRGILWRELKNQTRKPTPAQVKTGKALTAIGQDYALWRPEDWFSGRIQAEIAALAGLRGAG